MSVQPPKNECSRALLFICGAFAETCDSVLCTPYSFVSVLWIFAWSNKQTDGRKVRWFRKTTVWPWTLVITANRCCLPASRFVSLVAEINVSTHRELVWRARLLPLPPLPAPGPPPPVYNAAQQPTLPFGGLCSPATSTHRGSASARALVVAQFNTFCRVKRIWFALQMAQYYK